jgi:tRNA threonylcarbamoyladenosine biosynthesis protein TsaB
VKQLAFDTSTDACAVGLQIGAVTHVDDRLEARAHTRILMPMIRSLLDEHGLGVTDLDVITLGNGPGSFIGMRIGASVAQGLAFGAGLRIVPVSSLETVAAEVFARHVVGRTIVTQDARMNEVYLAAFRRGADGLPVREGGPVLHGVGSPLEIDLADCVAAGAGWLRYPALRAALPEAVAVDEDALYPGARWLLACGARDHAAGRSIDPRDVEPAYVRHKVAAVPES